MELSKNKSLVEEQIIKHLGLDISKQEIRYIPIQNLVLRYMKYKTIEEAAKNDDLLELRYLLSISSNLDSDAKHALWVGSEYGHIKIVKHVLEEYGIDVNLALWLGSEHNHLEIVEYSMDCGANVHSNDDFAVRISAKNGHLEIFNYLVKCGANIYAKNNHALRLSSSNDHIKIIKILLKKMGKKYGNIALRWAALNGKINTVRDLVRSGVDARENNNIAKRWSIKGGHLEVTKYLDYSNDVNRSDLLLILDDWTMIVISMIICIFDKISIIPSSLWVVGFIIIVNLFKLIYVIVFEWSI
jgi:ankyrin repeat protein